VNARAVVAAQAGARMKQPKARSAAECERLEQLPNVGPAIAADLRRLGIRHPQDLAGRDALALYQALCRATGRRQDPCVLDTLLAVVDFMRGAPPRPWWAYTVQRKATFGSV
jgi:Pathogenicity locus